MKKFIVYLLVIICFTPVTFFLLTSIGLVPYMLASVWSLEIEGILTFLAFAFGWIGLTSVFVAINIPLGKALNQSQTKYCRIGLVLGSLSVLKCYQLMGFEPKLLIFVLLPLLAALSLFYLTFRKYG